MSPLTTRQVAKKLGIAVGTLSRYISSKKVPEPQVVEIGGFRVHSWTEADVEHVRKLLPRIANGRKTRWQKLKEKNQKQARASKPRPVRRKKK